ncbi:2-C-methyl-D-erythritol 2,4-cyclodiphosphate synthase [bacterium SCSIO 12741]|nr:2-C-methyl-D-erythritol 2,4-cyclodiphosphate synthase [bacterium SCSIO 12741]
MDIRVGFGYDIHRLAEGESLWLGGIELEYVKGTVGHSDADVLIHAICDALLGSLNLRDIGFHFPDTDPQYKGADSKKLLAGVMELIRDKGFELGNVDATVVMELPKLNPHIPEMQRCLGEVMGVDSDRISIKATTSEKLGFVGTEDGVKSYATVLVKKS